MSLLAQIAQKMEYSQRLSCIFARIWYHKEGASKWYTSGF